MASRSIHPLLIALSMAAAAAIGYQITNWSRPVSKAGDANEPHISLTGASKANAEEGDGDLGQLALVEFGEALYDDFGDADGPVRPKERGPATDPRVAAGARSSESEPAVLVSHCVDVAHDIDSELGSQLARQQQQNPQQFEQLIRHGHMGRRLLAMAQLKQRDPELYQIKLGELSQSVQINRVAAELREAMKTGKPGQADALKEQLRALLRIQLALSMKTRAEYLCRIEEQMQSVREEISHQAEHFQATVEGRLQQLVQEPNKVKAPAAIPVSAAMPAAEARSNP